MAILKASTAYTRTFLLVQSSDHLTGLTGATPAVTLSKAGAAFGAAGGTVTEIANGFYKVALTTTDTNTVGDLAYHITAASGDPTDFVDQVADATVALLGVNTVNIGGTAQTGRDLGASVLLSVGTGTGQVNLSGGSVPVTSSVKKNQALNGFTFIMTDSTNHNPATGKTVTAQRSLDGAAFASCANSVTEVSNGLYTINLASGDLNGNTVDLRFTATACDDLNILIITQP